MKTMQLLSPLFNTNGMVKDYTKQYYLQVADRFKRFCENDFENAKVLL